MARSSCALRAAVLGALIACAAAVHARERADCTPIAGSAALLAAGRTVLVGEMHGTRELPAALYRMVCSALRRGVPVAVGLEVNDEDGALSRFMDAGDEPAASQHYLATRFWMQGRDGRASSAMFDTIAALKALRRQGLPLSVFALYDSRMLSDRKMAERLRRERLARPDSLIVTLTGNVHNMLETPAGMPLTMGTLVADLKPLAVNLVYSGGSAWWCQDVVCGAKALPMPPYAPRELWTVLPARDARLYSVEVGVGTTTASPPAAERTAELAPGPAK
jgi:hypothetical protein